ncbi:FUSC family protein [Nitrospirillum sp. BR 11828]|uniref:FUSC family protein n=1 Tax=Nitrospirillum sp. BR 11828 TaxID=3104325 RepID=UPI002ACA4B20|nr:FUSC family protein [Nitrospirillum sp. BR 11828]MDZ5648739.1 FUSC family protein [Nitrospirillum sp. BR 11828]
MQIDELAGVPLMGGPRPNPAWRSPVPSLSLDPAVATLRPVFKSAGLPRLGEWLPSRGALGHAVRTAMAALLALYLAYALQLESPQTAAVTVLIVSHPMSGAVIAKSVWRIAGTLVGATAALALMAGFGQSPEAFLLLYSLWLAGCVALANRLRRFRSYAAVLAGYTLALVALGAVDDPLRTFDIAAARVAAIVVGVLAKMTVSGILWPVTAAQRLESRVARVTAAVIGALAHDLTGADAPGRRHRELLADLQGLDDLATYAAVESAAYRRQSDGARVAAAALFGLLARVDAARRALASLPAAAEPLLACLTPLAGGDGPAFRVAAAAARRRLRVALHLAHRAGDTAALTAAHQLGEVLDLLVQVAVARDPARRLAFTLPEPADGPLGSAIIAALRTLISVGLAAGFWVATEWPAGTIMLSWTSAFGALLASRSNPEQVSVQVFRAALWAGLLGLPVTFLLLPALSEFWGLSLVLAPIIVVAALMSQRPGRGDFGSFMPLLFLTLVAPTNPMNYDLQAFLNAAAAIVLAAIWILLTYRLILPVDGRGEVRRLLASFSASVRALASGASSPDGRAWEYRHHHRLARLAVWEVASGGGVAGNGEGALAQARARMDVGRALIAMRGLLPGLAPQDRRRAELVMLALGRLIEDPPRLSAFARRAGRRLEVTADDAEGPRRRGLLDLAAWCRQLAGARQD